VIRGRLRIGGMIEIPVGIFFRDLRVLGLRPSLGFCGCRGGRPIGSRRRADGGAKLGIVLASSHQIAESEDDSKNDDEQQKQSNQVPALQHEIAAAFFFS
jgi:hypothetical protein